MQAKIWRLRLHNVVPLMCLKCIKDHHAHTLHTHTLHTHTHTQFRLCVLLLPFSSTEEESTDSLMKLVGNFLSYCFENLMILMINYK